jgi:DNA-binding transcriptional LysR family regulator
MIDSDRLRSFIAFGEALNFTRAAAQLHLSQPALHVQVAKLAEDLGQPLYRRVGRGLELTDAGQAVLAFARDQARRADALRASLGAGPAPIVGLAAGEGVLLYVLAEPVRRLAGRAGVDLRILTRDQAGVLAALRAGAAQVGVTALTTPPDDLRAVRAATSTMIAVMPLAHRLARRRAIALADLADERLIVPPAGRPHREFLERALAAARVPWQRAVEASGWEVMMRYAALGVGIAIVNDICAVPRGAIARPVPALAPVAYYVLTRPGLAADDPATELAERAVAAFRARHT